jgi:predicted DNA-binding WGR domain protein
MKMSSAYPIEVLKQSGRAESRSGGKDYHLVMIRADNGNCIVINRWGKKDAWGVGFKVERYGDGWAAKKAYEAKFAEKLNKEYDDHFVNKNVTCADEAAFKKALGPYFFKMKPEDLTWLVPGIDTTGAKEQKNVEWEQRADGSYTAVEARKLVEEAVEPVADRIAENPAWGTW